MNMQNPMDSERPDALHYMICHSHIQKLTPSNGFNNPITQTEHAFSTHRVRVRSDYRLDEPKIRSSHPALNRASEMSEFSASSLTIGEG